MKNNFREAYVNIFENSFTLLRRIIRIKIKAISYCNKYMAQNKVAVIQKEGQTL